MLVGQYGLLPHSRLPNTNAQRPLALSAKKNVQKNTEKKVRFPSKKLHFEIAPTVEEIPIEEIESVVIGKT